MGSLLGHVCTHMDVFVICLQASLIYLLHTTNAMVATLSIPMRAMAPTPPPSAPGKTESEISTDWQSHSFT